MPRSHICTTCGQELGAIAPTFEPVYGLPIVRCIRCGVTHVRTYARDYAVRRWRKLVLGALYAGVNFAATVALIALVGGITLATARHMSNYSVHPLDVVTEVARGGQKDPDSVIFAWWEDQGGARLVAFLCVCVLMGASWQVLFRHWRRWVLFVVIVGAVHLIIFAPHAINWFARMRTAPGQAEIPPFQGLYFSGTRLAVVLFWCGVIVALPGLALGRMAARAQRNMRRSILRRYRNSIRMHKGLA